MAKLPGKYVPFDPAKAMRERNLQDEAIPKLTLAQRSVRKPALRPLPAPRSKGE
jgi:hypothetical protein